MSASLKASVRARTLAVLGDSSRPSELTENTGILGRGSGLETHGLAVYCGLGGKPGGEREGELGGERGGDWGVRGARGGGVRGVRAAGTEGAGLGAALVGVEGAVSPLS